MSAAPKLATAVRWAVFNVLTVNGRRRYRPALILEGVPDGTSRRAVIALLEGAGATARFETAGVAWANHVVLPESRWPDASRCEWAGNAPNWTWEGLQGAQDSRNITLVLPPSEYASVVLAARGAGESVNAWCRRTLTTAAQR